MNVSEMKIRTDKNKVIVTIPHFRKHPELWDNLAIGTVKIIKDEKIKEEMLNLVISLYSKIEEDELN